MKKYLGVKLIEAEPMTRGDYNKFKGWTIPENENPDDEGYLVKYSDDYISWSPEEPFEKSYLELCSENLKNTITQEDVNDFIETVETIKVGEKTTFVTVTLVNGFELTDSASCFDPANYDHTKGEKICLDRIKNKLWSLLAFLLQSGLNGFYK